MPVIRLRTRINAPRERVFDLARSVDVHIASMSAHGERPVAGVTRGLLQLGDEVTWEARHLGVRQRLTARMTALDRPRHFRDAMVAGAFRRFDHDHWFESDGAATVMTDAFDYTAPLRALGALADLLFLRRYVARMLAGRNRALRELAESEAWRAFLG